MSGRQQKRLRRASLQTAVNELSTPKMERISICQCPAEVGPHQETERCRELEKSFSRWWRKVWSS